MKSPATNLLYRVSVMLAAFASPLCLAAAWEDASPSSGELRFTPSESASPTQSSDSLLAMLLTTRYTTRVSGLIATTHLEQHFLNDSLEWREATYRFPLPDTAAIAGMKLQTGDMIITGKIAEKQQAQAIYEQAKARGVSTALTGQQRPNLFVQRIANIPPGETVIVHLDFQHQVEYTNATFSLHLPTTVTPRYTPANSAIGMLGTEAATFLQTTLPADLANGSHTTHIEVIINDSLPIESIDSPTHDVIWHNDTNATRVAMTDEDIAMDKDFSLFWKTRSSDNPAILSGREIAGKDTFVQLMVEPPHDSAGFTVLPKEQIWVIDTSGSMEGISLEQAKAALLAGLGKLHTNDTFNIIEFNDSARSLFASPVEASPEWIRVAQRRINRLTASGGTEISGAISSAIENRSDNGHLRQIIFLTDGSVSNETELFRQIAAKLGDSRLFTIGIGPAPNRFFMRKAAEFGRGTSQFIQSLADVSSTIEQLSVRLEKPVLKDIRISLDYPTDVVLETLPAAIPDLYAGEPLTLTIRLPASVAEEGTLLLEGSQSAAGFEQLSGVTAWQERIELASVTQQTGIGRAWARAQIDALEDQKFLGKDAVQVRNEVLSIALRHSLVSPYTSFVAVAEEPVNTAGEPLHSTMLPTLLPQGISRNMASFPTTATPAPLLIRTGLLTLLASLLLAMIEHLMRRRQGNPGVENV
jgi:Ca-activated chloride channel family protein